MKRVWGILFFTLFLTGFSFTQETANQKPEQALTQFERDYVLLKGGQFEFEENFTYTYYSANQIFLESFAILDPVFLTLGKFGIQTAKRNIFINTFMLRYGIRDNFQAEVSLPIVYRYDMVGVPTGTGQSTGDKHMERFGFGDVALGVSFQPVKETVSRPAVILNLGVKTKTGKSPFDIDPNNDVPTGTGYYSVRAGINLIKGVDPVVVFGGLGYIYNIKEKVNKTVKSDLNGDGDTEDEGETGFLKYVYPGDTINLSLGMAYAISYTFSLSTQFIQNYTLSTYIDNGTGKKRVQNSTLNSALFKFGAGMAVSPSVPVSFAVYIGLTEDAPDYMVELRIPIKF
ncbi:outer membrane putative beta-barrel porin/alpha-amylase [Hydrogenivirga caldilitoris]|uniref:Outer membrane putative beta-barrel porin/alpha-amylase n=1 Tax=Hydrogenivirga caldilitoris TaxID=246264 RepID=A0A497XSI0_9AQUI|nr:transporter [Hydrogenivirga caldilitoris]RLJ70092.1 outer membrane putative beta-barrel porin/alpha-amylase [Hydrogenivirga caldilitoris]